MNNIKVAVAMSGGVDSGVAAKLLVEQGYQVAGVHMKLFEEASSGKRLASSLKSARKTARILGIPFRILDFSNVFKKKVVDYFLSEYTAGRTPNPCVRCNRFIKFGELLDYVRALGFDYLATGHYARLRSRKSEIRNPKSEIYHLSMARDKSKDQSYFLYNLTQEQLPHILFPIGDYTKKQVRQMARRWKLPVAQRPESQEICFLQGSDYRPFLKRYIIGNSIKPGEVVNVRGRVVGRHFGLPLYTVGQRHGFDLIGSKAQGFKGLKRTLIPPYYVIRKDILRNRLIVGFGKETEKKEFGLRDINLVNSVKELKGYELRVRVRSQGELLKCQINKCPNKQIKVRLTEPERGIAAGQAAVFYRPVTGCGLRVTSYKVLGGGIIV